MMKTSFSVIGQISLTAVMALMVCQISSAQTLVGYNFNGLTGDFGPGSEVTVSPNANDSSAFDAGTIGASVISRGSNYGNQTQGNGFFTANSIGIQPVDNVFTSSVATADSNGSYITFNVTPATGDVLTLTTLSFGGGDQNGLGALGLSYSLDGTNFTTIGSDSGIPAGSYTGGDGGYTTPLLATVDLSSIAALQKVTGTVTFELSLLNAGGYTTGDFTRDHNNGTAANLDDVSLTGTERTIPEPSAWALMLVGAGGLLLTRKLIRRA